LARKIRVYELAKHYGTDSTTLLKMLRDMHAEVKSHMSIVEDEMVDKIHAVFQHRRDQMRLQYARMHNMDPEKLKHVASFRPLERPQPPEEPEKEKKATKKKATKKKTTKKKAAKKTTKKAAKKATKEAAPEPAGKDEEAAATVAAAESRETEAAEPTVKKAPPRRRARIVRKAQVRTEPAAEEARDTEPAGDESPAAPAPAAETAQAEPAPAAETTAAPAEKEAPASGKEDEAAADTAPAPAEKPAPEPVPVNKRPRRTARIIRMGNGVVQTTTGKPQPEQPAAGEKWDWNELLPGGRQVSSSVKESVRDSIQAALQRRQGAGRPALAESGRRKRRRKKRQEVDQAAVDASLRETLAQMDGSRGKKRYRRSGGAATEEQAAAVGDVLRVTEFITVQELAEKFEVPAREIIAKLFSLGVLATMNQRLERDQIELLAEEFEKQVEFLEEYGEDEFETPQVSEEDLEPRPPVVTVMGHVDHGKTSLLDYIRKTNVIAGEAGGITQHIGAYKVETAGGPITFLDTPGHEAFSAMRARGAQVTDIVILVVAADDRIMPQTIEAINHAKAAGAPIIVAINKIDLPGARPDLVKQDLLNHGVVVEEFGGEVLCAEISAKHGTNIDKLLELVHLQAEILDLKATPKGPAHGVVIEASKEPGRGVVFTVLVQQGTLKLQDCFVAGLQAGRVRALLDERGDHVEAVHPGEPAVVLGAEDVPTAGDRLHVVESEREAREIAAKRRHLQRIQQFSAPKKAISLDNLAELMTDSEMKELPIIVKGDVSGSVEAICDSLLQLNTDEVQVKIVHKGVGAISESDVLLAANTGAMIIGFHMRPGAAILEKAKQEGVTIEVFDIIYEVVDTMKKAMAGLLGSISREVATGRAEIRQVFRIPKIGTVAGAYVLEGTILRNSLARLVRDEVMIYEGKISSLKRFKEDVREVQAGYECGIGLENFHDLQEGDVIETFRIEEEERTEL